MIDPVHPEAVLLSAAVELPVAERVAFLDRACGGDTALRRQIESLIEAHEQAEGFLDAPVAGGDRPPDLDPDAPVTEKPGDRIGRYKLLQPIGEGGCGIVYLAEQEEPVRRQVALKVIKLGMDTRQVIARFEAERQALALMDHPNIARVLDGGATETGRPYFVMELVRGVRITDYCEQRRLSIRARLRLFMDVCHAVQHAHQKGVIHRDLKPSNILVIESDDPGGAGCPKVIDFGIAKATEQRLTEKTLLTQLTAFIGTPAYMSPEQAQITGVDVDTRSDIYSLGVLLYELLTGRPPFDEKQLLAAGLDEMRRTIREVEPPKPSTRLMQARTATEMEATARVETRSLNAGIDKDLDWIVMKCLEKERGRRYETANGLVADVQRHLNNEPVNARPPSNLYRLQKMVRRNRLVFAAGGVLVVALIIVAIGSAIAAWRVAGARHAEQLERRNAETANRALRQTISLLELERAEDIFSARDSAAGVAHLAAILRRDPTNSIAARRLVSALVHQRWALPASPPMRHLDRVISAVFSPDGRHILTASWDGNARLWDAVSGRLVSSYSHQERVACAHFSAAGDRIVTASADKTAHVWSATNGAIAPLILRHEGKVNWAEFSPDGRWIATAAENSARIWDAASGALKQELRAHMSNVIRVRFSPDGEQLVTGGSHGSVRLWRVATGEMLFRVEDRSKALTELAFSPDGRLLVMACEDGIARIWNVATGQEVGEPITHNSNSPKPIWHAVFSPDSKLLLTTSEGGTARLWDAGTSRAVGEAVRHESGVIYGRFSPDGQTVVTSSSDNTARVWDVRTGAPACQPLRHIERVLAAGFSPDGGRLVTAGYDGIAQIWDLRDRLERGLQIRHNVDVLPFGFSSDGKAILTGARDKTARLWNAQSGEPLTDWILHDSLLTCGDLAPDGKRVALAGVNGSAGVWDCSDAKGPRLVVGPMRHSSVVRSICFDLTGSRLVTASDDGSARVWDALTGQAITEPLQHEGPVTTAQFSPDGRFVVTASTDRTARIWNARDGKPVGEILKHIDHVNWAEFSPDGTRVVTASTDNMAGLWNGTTGRPISTGLPHPRMVSRAVFSPDGRRVATASLDRMARIWDAATGQSLTPPLSHESFVQEVAFSADGAQLMTAGQTGLARFWDSPTGRPLTEWLKAARYWGACFDRMHGRIALGTRDGVVRIWTVPAGPTPVPEWFPRFAEAVAGVRLAESGALELAPNRDFQAFTRPATNNPGTEVYWELAGRFISVSRRAR